MVQTFKIMNGVDDVDPSTWFKKVSDVMKRQDKDKMTFRLAFYRLLTALLRREFTVKMDIE